MRMQAHIDTHVEREVGLAVIPIQKENALYEAK